MPLQDSPALLRALVASDVEFILVGGLAAIAHGSSLFTRDLDVLARFDVANMERLLAAVEPAHPRFALHPNRPPLDQSAEELALFRNVYLTTDHGRLDVLGRIPNGTYEELERSAVEMELAGVRCRVLSLDDLITSKAMLGRDKDKLVEVELRAIRDRTMRQSANEDRAKDGDP